MRHDINSNNTKTVLATSLKELVNSSPASVKISVNSIVAHCGVNRNTFYYHFSNINELIYWTMYNDFYRHIRSFDSLRDGKQIRDLALKYFQTNHKFLSFAYRYIDYDMFWEAYVRELTPIVSNYIDALCFRSSRKLDMGFRQFAIDMYAEQVTAIYLTLIHKPTVRRSTMALKCLETIFDYSIPDLLTHESDILSIHP